MANLLCQALYANKRLVGCCMSFISEIDEDCYDERNIENIFRQSAGGTIIIELRGLREEHKNYANCFEKVIQDFSEKICKYQPTSAKYFQKLPHCSKDEIYDKCCSNFRTLPGCNATSRRSPTPKKLH